MTLLIILTDAGADTGPTFNLYSDLDLVNPLNPQPVTKETLMQGGYLCYNVPEGTTSITIVSVNNEICPNSIVIQITTATSTSTTSTSTTTFVPDYNYGYNVNEYTMPGGPQMVRRMPGLIVGCELTGNRTVANSNDGLIIGNFYASNNGLDDCVFEILEDRIDISGGGYLETIMIGEGYATCAEVIPN